MPYPPHPGQIAQCQTLTPNVKKMLAKNALSAVFFLIILIVLILVLHWTVGLGIFLIPLESFGISVNTTSLLWGMIFLSMFLFIGLLAASYLLTGNARYEFYPDKLIAYRPSFLVFLSDTEVPYENILRLSFSADDFFDSLLRTGTIIVELTGMHHQHLNLPCVDDVEQRARYVTSIIQQYQLTRQAKFTEEYRISGIFDKENYYVQP
ncbi:hypothetical protein HYS47_04465 [Candidatus Woesearchaeota archaeon]|nr:hypothetical protein [Candidatus Woesearchaeota archaeon]